MTQRHVERLLGRLLTDEDLRTAFIRDARATLEALRDQGLDLTDAEIEAFLSKPPGTWRDMANQVPARLKKCSLRTE